MRRSIRIIEAASELGAGKRGASLGPRALKLEALAQQYPAIEQLEWHTAAADDSDNFEAPQTSARHIIPLYHHLAKVCDSVESCLRDGHFPLILSGDHSNGTGAFSGVRNFHPEASIGIIWVDAHFDLHSPYTTPSGNLHGMAVNALLGMDNLGHKRQQPDGLSVEYWEKIKHLGSRQISPKANPDQLVFIGVRDFESQEADLVREQQIRNFAPDELRQKGMSTVLAEALEYLQHCDLIYVSFDVDSQDTSISVGTGTPVPDGLSNSDAMEVFTTLFQHPKVAAFEITEINPLLDTENRMAKAVLEYLKAVL